MILHHGSNTEIDAVDLERCVPSPCSRKRDAAMSDKVAQLIEFNTQDLVKMIVEDRRCSVSEAMQALYGSATYAGLADPETGLDLESPSYLYEVYRQVG